MWFLHVLHFFSVWIKFNWMNKYEFASNILLLKYLRKMLNSKFQFNLMKNSFKSYKNLSTQVKKIFKSMQFNASYTNQKRNEDPLSQLGNRSRCSTIWNPSFSEMKITIYRKFIWIFHAFIYICNIWNVHILK